MTSGRTGREIANQFIIEDEKGTRWFQSYHTVIAKQEYAPNPGRLVTTLDHCWDYSKTTGKYRNQFLSETRKETEAKIKDGTYIVTNLNS